MRLTVLPRLHCLSAGVRVLKASGRDCAHSGGDGGVAAVLAAVDASGANAGSTAAAGHAAGGKAGSKSGGEAGGQPPAGAAAVNARSGSFGRLVRGLSRANQKQRPGRAGGAGADGAASPDGGLSRISPFAAAAGAADGGERRPRRRWRRGAPPPWGGFTQPLALLHAGLAVVLRPAGGRRRW